MHDRWISVTAESTDCVRIARLDDLESGLATFGVHDMKLRIDSIDQYDPTLVAEMYTFAADVPDQYSRNMIFRVVLPSEGEFTVSSYDQFTDRVDGDEYTVGLRFDATLSARHRDIIQEIIS